MFVFLALMSLRSLFMVKVGIDAMGFYTSQYYLDLKTLASARGVDVNKYVVGLGQHKMAVMSPDEDIVTMAADAGHRVLRHIDKNKIELLLFATESGTDQSKAAGIFVHRLLNLPARCRVVELKQACYSATAGLQLALPMLRENPDKLVLLIASDVARYGLHSAGESSQGGGAVAMVLSANPRLLEIEPESGFNTEDVMDFWRPNYRDEALVDGKYSCEVYLRLVQKTWEQYSALSNRTYFDHSHFCYHVPVPKLVEKAHQCLLKMNGLPKLSAAEVEAQLGPSLHYGRVIGNCYSAALYLSLISLLENTHESMAGKRIGFYSYGSGCVAEFFSGVVQPHYQKQLDMAYHQQLLEKRTPLLQEEYESFYTFSMPVDGSSVTVSAYQKGKFRLAAFKEHKRIYEAIDDE
jgi:hydroxymethylglutaryl-CoA synthase